MTTCELVQNKTGDFEKVRQNTERSYNARNEVGTRHLKSSNKLIENNRIKNAAKNCS